MFLLKNLRALREQGGLCILNRRQCYLPFLEACSISILATFTSNLVLAMDSVVTDQSLKNTTPLCIKYKVKLLTQL